MNEVAAKRLEANEGSAKSSVKSSPKSSANLLLPVIFALLTILGVVCWVLQLTKGLQLTNLNNYMTWGLYIIGFMLFTGVAAGCLLFASSTYLFSGFASYRPYARIASFLGAICGVIAAGLFIIVDIGNPERAWYMVTNLHIASPMFWDSLVLLSYVIVGIIFTRQLMAVASGKKTEKSLRPISIIAFIAGLGVSVTSFVFALQTARPLWNNPGQVLSFLFAAIVAAGAVLILVYAVLNRSDYIAMSEEVSHKIGTLLAFFLLAEFMLVISEVIIGAYVGIGEEPRIISWLTSGEGAIFFWLEMAAFVVGFALLLQKKRSLHLVGAGFGIVAIFLVKYNMLQAQLLNPALNYAGPPGYSGIISGVYFPSMIEWGVALGILSFGALLLVLGLRKLKLGDSTLV